jgi:hypothetical protein
MVGPRRYEAKTRNQNGIVLLVVFGGELTSDREQERDAIRAWLYPTALLFESLTTCFTFLRTMTWGFILS